MAKADEMTHKNKVYKEYDVVTLYHRVLRLPHWSSVVFNLRLGQLLYSQVEMAETNKAKPAFCTPFSICGFRYMLFGLLHCTQHISVPHGAFVWGLPTCQYSCILTMCSLFVQQHLEQLRGSTQNKQGLKVKLSRCEFFKSKSAFNQMWCVVSAE